MAYIKDIIHQKYSTVDNNNVKKEDNKDNTSIKREHSVDCESKTPLAVPMVADTKHQSLSRNDAKAITETRLKRLKELSRKPEDTLSKQQKDEKRRIVRLEKNRRAAAMSRRKKKMYVCGLEEKCNLMARHLTILEMENSHLRALLNAQTHTNVSNIHIPNGLPPLPFHIPMPNFLPSNNQNSTNTNSHKSRNNSEDCNSESEPVLKRRRLNDGSTLTLTPPTVSSDNSSLSDITPLPIINNESHSPSFNPVSMCNLSSYKNEGMNEDVPPAIIVPNLDLVLEGDFEEVIEETVDGFGTVFYL